MWDADGVDSCFTLVKELVKIEVLDGGVQFDVWVVSKDS